MYSTCGYNNVMYKLLLFNNDCPLSKDTFLNLGLTIVSPFQSALKESDYTVLQFKNSKCNI